MTDRSLNTTSFLLPNHAYFIRPNFQKWGGGCTTAVLGVLHKDLLKAQNPNSLFKVKAITKCCAWVNRIHSDEGLTLETSVFESFTVANLPY